MNRFTFAVYGLLILMLAGPLHAEPQLKPFEDFGDNPGNLNAFVYIPDNAKPGAALVVALHGCTQKAIAFDDEPGWTHVADKYNLVLLFPEQKQMNSAWICFNWMEPGDQTRGSGEAASIADMTKAAIERFDIDPDKVFVTGLSGGGAMTNVMLATYPELYAGGAPVASPPYKCATNSQESFDCLSRKIKDPKEWGDLVRSASDYTGERPKVSIWHGERDRTVRHNMMEEEVKQWTNVFGLPTKPTRIDKVGKHERAVWVKDGVEVIEAWTLDRLKHGSPIKPGDGDDECGVESNYAHDAGVCGPYYMLKFWGVLEPKRK